MTVYPPQTLLASIQDSVELLRAFDNAELQHRIKSLARIEEQLCALVDDIEIEY